MKISLSLLRIVCITLPLFLFIYLPNCSAETADQNEDNGQQYVTIDFNDVDINIFIKYISELTGKNFIVDRTVKGKVTILSPTRMTVEDAYRVFESVLEVHGFTTVPSGPVTKIVPSVQARSKSIPTVRDGEKTSSSDKVVTRIISMKHSDPAELKKILTPLLSKTSNVIAHSQSGMMILTDVRSNIKRLIEIIKEIDVPSVGEDLVIIPLQYASVADVGKSISQLFVQSTRTRKRSSSSSPNIKIIPYERTNSLIVFAPTAEIKKLRSLLEQLDTEAPRGGGKIHVYYLQHANAEELVKVLSSLPTKQAKTTSKNTKAEAAKAPPLSTDLQITADPETNSLIITAPKEEYLILEEIIKKLDIPRRMVYLEALIMEVSIAKEFQLGVEWGGLGSFHDETGTLGSGFTNNNFGLLQGIDSGVAGMADGATLGILKKGVEIGGVYFPDIGAVVNAFKTDSDINIIATPQVLTTDNKEASITVGQNVPYITSKNTSETGSTQDYTNYEYKDVGTTLKITPQINQANLLRLEIGVEVTRLKSEAGGATPTTYKRSADTTVVVHNEEIVVIGGMIGQDITSGDYKVPLLGDIPGLGWLFKTHEDRDNKTNMFIFIMPRIVESSPELADIYQHKQDIMENALEGAGDVPEQILQVTPNQEHVFAFIDLGFAKLQQKKYLEAKGYFQQALKIQPDNPYALINMGIIYEHEKQFTKAAEIYQQVLDFADSHEDSAEADHTHEDQALLNTARENLRKLRREGVKK
ncbi:general secretion pathway protein D [Candidatus Electrothrix aarhusensis]|uniref:General secretion pathway protein D n=1 Tax=Candidatus Electrothrix aarhusensis TaxID=1859131 RepID=A0A444IYN6_9BACT|nr:general secretion pathway protein D [Candidatus Electrothrix aarhusensis]